jgi:two-component system CheB/CheR fusion protein
VKNTLTVVQSMVHQTWRTSGSPEAFIERLDGRISALANSHRLLVDAEWEGTELRQLIESQISPYIADNLQRVRMRGEEVRLPPHLATPFGLVLHELATNAAKYGALSNQQGHVDLHWRLTPGNPNPTVTVEWSEHDGPPVKEARMPGFGSRLIQSGLPGAAVRYEFLPDGVRCTIEFALEELPQHGGEGV